MYSNGLRVAIRLMTVKTLEEPGLLLRRDTWPPVDNADAQRAGEGYSGDTVLALLYSGDADARSFGAVL